MAQVTTPTGGRRTAFQYVQDELRRRILSGDLPGGMHLAQTDMAQELGVSTTPVREAFRQLASEGLVSLDAHRGVVVCEPNLEDVEEVFALRQLLEVHAAKLAVSRITDDEIDEVRGLHQAMLATDSIPDWIALNRSFHHGIVEAARSPRLSGMLRGLLDSSALYLGLALRTVEQPYNAGNEDHERIISAIARRDEAAVESAVVEHIEHGLVNAREAFLEK